MQTGNFNSLQTEKNFSPPFSGTYNNGATEMAQYANNGSFGNTPGAAAFQTFNTTGNGNTGTARTLRVGDRFTITGFVATNPSLGGYIGISFRASTTYTNFFSATDANTVARFQLDNTGNWKVYSGSTVVATSSSGANADRTFSLEITSSNTFNATIGSETYYDLSFGATGPISSFAIYTYGDANANSFWKNGSLSNIGHEAGTGLRFGYDMSSGSRNISGIISDGMNTNATSGTLVNKVLSGGSGNIVIFSGGNNYSGSTTVNSNGRLELQNASALGSTSGTTVTSGGTLSLYSATGTSYNTYALSLNGTGQSGTGALLNSGGANTWPGNITLGSSSTINSTNTGGSGSLTISGTIGLGANNITFGGSGNHTTVSGIISGTGKLIKSGTNNLILTAENTYTGNTEIDQGELWIGSGGSIASGSSIFVGNGAQTSNIAKLWLSNSTGGTIFSNNLTINNGNYSTRVLGGLNTSGTNTFSGNIISTASSFLTLSALNTGSTTSFTGIISGVATQLDIEGEGTVVLSGANTYTGKTYVTANTLTLGVANALPVGASAGIINIDGTGTKTINLGLFNLGTATTSAGSAGKLDIDANTTINLGASGTNAYYFKASDDQTWNATTVTINNWTGSVGLTGTGPKIYVGANENGLTSTQLSKITFNGFTAGAVLLGTGELVPKPLTPTITSFTPTSGFVGTTVTITGTNFAFITSVSIGGAAAASYTVNSTTQITAVVGAGATTGVVTIVALGGTVSSATNFTIGGYITTQTGDWNTGATWLGGAVPPAGVNVTVDHLITVNASVSNAPSAVTINASDGITFGASGALTATTITNNGSIVMTSGGTLTIANGGTLTNNATFTRGSGTVRFAGSATVSGTVAFN
ncbi:MAG: beta strand repeat-containing protein, partial [Bacteroidota bacterium]